VQGLAHAADAQRHVLGLDTLFSQLEDSLLDPFFFIFIIPA
jgi:hypothetical protein